MGNDDDDGGDGGVDSYAMIDLPPYSDVLADEIRNFMNRRAARDDDDVEVDAAPPAGHDVDDVDNVDGGGGTKRTKKKTTTTTTAMTGRRGNLDVILITSRQCIHYDASPGVYVTRRSDLTRWKVAFPGANVVMYRLDVPRECRDGVTQALDGYGPWGYNEVDGGCHDDHIDDIEGDRSAGRRRGMFVETGRPLTIEEWDDDTKSRVLTRGEFPPDDNEATAAGGEGDVDDDDDGDSSRYSPEAIRRREEAYRLLAMSSALSLIDDYIDRFRVILPARGDAVFLDLDTETRRRELMESVGLYKKISDIYARLGIVE
ncbi:hypothetical protein ACHAW5_004079 [Stephanodiscus triporus]|uniref:Uncharacterized protein n=1 Tax=Stephanodiscus triporus TaxID=2934178 RepID=A0ABD3PVR3_9STRA